MSDLIQNRGSPWILFIKRPKIGLKDPLRDRSERFTFDHSQTMDTNAWYPSNTLAQSSLIATEIPEW